MSLREKREENPYKHIRREIPPPDFTFRDKKRYGRPDRREERTIINDGLKEYYKEEN